MDKTKRWIALTVFATLSILLFIGSLVANAPRDRETVKELMRDAVLHDVNKVDLLGIKDVNPGLISAFAVTAILTLFVLAVRIFVIPRFKKIPARFQLLLEAAVGYFDRLAKTNSPHRNRFLGAYLFSAGAYIAFGTCFELFGFQAVTTKGSPVTLSAPLADINGALMMGCLSYLVILSGGLAQNGLRGLGAALKEFSLPISMSFRIFGALLSGALVTELVYYFMAVSYGLPVLVGVMFTLLHALVQTYVLTMLTSVFYGEVTEPPKKKKRIEAGG